LISYICISINFVETKNQWARDDPAFVVTEGIFVGIGALAYAIAFLPGSLWGYLWSVLYCVLVDWLLVGFVVASTCCHISNKYLKSVTSAHAAAQDVEWVYAFDVHCNAFICSYAVTYVLQYFMLPLLVHKGVMSTVVANSLYSVAIVWYAYITHLGYKALPFLSNSQVFFWYTLIATVFLWIFLVVIMLMGLQLNFSRIVMNFHYGG
jgi:hypothetical protein